MRLDELQSEPFAARLCGSALLITLAMCLALMGCERREKVLDVETPGADIEVHRTTDPIDGSKGVEIETSR